MKKIKRKISALLLAFAMILGVVAPSVAKADEDGYAEAQDTKVTIHKMLLEDLTEWKKDGRKNDDGSWSNPGKTANYTGNEIADLQAYFGTNEGVDGVKFTYWKVTKVQYEEMVKNPEFYKTKEQVEEITVDQGTKPDAKGDTKETKNGQVEVGSLEKGYYWFVENPETNIEGNRTVSDYVGVPFGLKLPAWNKDGSQIKDLHVYPKNTVSEHPDNEKTLDAEANPKIENNTANVGDKVPYKVTSVFKKGSTYKIVAWNDRMSKGLTFNEDVILSSDELGVEFKVGEQNDYKIDYSDNGFVLRLTDNGLNKLKEKTKIGNVTITLKYSATINADAVVDGPLDNTNSLHYGNNPEYKPEPGDNTPEPQPGVTEINVVKKFSNGTVADANEEWPTGLEITFKLQVYNAQNHEWEDANKSITLNEGKKTDKFSGLDEAKVYRVVEVESKGWTPNYQVQPDGSLKVINKKNPNPKQITPETVDVRSGGKKFKKVDEENNGLKNAIFLVKNEAGNYLFAKPAKDKEADKTAYEQAEAAYRAAIEQFNQLSSDKQTSEAYNAVEEAKKNRDNAFKAMKAQWEYKTFDSDDAAVTAGAYKLVSGEEGKFEITGLAYGNYKLVEIQSPQGYAKRTEAKEFTVAADSYKDENTLEVLNKKITIPQTGGIGTIIFTVVGLAIMGGAIVAMRKRELAESK